MGEPSVERIITHGWYGATPSRVGSVSSNGWYPPVLSLGESLVDVLAYPGSYSTAWMPYLAIGESNLVVGLTPNMAEEIYRKIGSVHAIRNTYFIEATFGLDEPTGDGYELREIGLVDAEDEGNLVIRWTLNTETDKDNLDDVDMECAVTILHGA